MKKNMKWLVVSLILMLALAACVSEDSTDEAAGSADTVVSRGSGLQLGPSWKM